ncbi:ChaN family lipoprotein [Limimonas halophila]|nr:ChaN family lipoprotein [Limimonas halophila]
MTRISRLLLCLAVLVGAAPASAGDPPPLPEAWRSEQGRGHPLVGTIHDVAAGERIAPATLIERTAGARFVLLGETHTNPDHHRLQAWMLRALVAQGQHPAVIWEMIDQTQDDVLRRYQHEPSARAAVLGNALDWSDSGWPAWRLYQPIAETALAHGLPMHAGAAGRAERSAVAHKDLTALDLERRRSLALDTPLPEPSAAGLRERLEAAHCGQMPASAIDAMLAMQRLRDATLADSLLNAADDAGSAVLIAGSGHVRADWGVPWYLRQRGETGVVTVAFREVRADTTDAAAYLPATTATPAFDYLWFTPRAAASERDCSDS